MLIHPNLYALFLNCLHFVFTKGGCECSNRYIDDDCSKDITTPPVNTSLPANGLCTTSTRACRKTNIYGDFLSTNIWCKIRYFKEVFESSIESHENKKDSNKTIIAVASSFCVVGVAACVLVLLFYLKHKHTEEKTKVDVYSGCHYESGENVDNDILSVRTKT